LTVLMPEWDDRQRQRALQAFTEGLTEGHIAAAIRAFPVGIESEGFPTVVA
jgi:Xaa-Pro aminopeptidase